MRHTLVLLCVVTAVAALIATAHATEVEHVKVVEEEVHECLRSNPTEVVLVFDLVNGPCEPGKGTIGSVTWHQYFEVAFIRRGDDVQFELRPAGKKVHFAGKGVKQCASHTINESKQETTSLFWTIENSDTDDCSEVPPSAWAFQFKDFTNGSRKLVAVGMTSKKFRVDVRQLTSRGFSNVQWVLKRAILPGLRSAKMRVATSY